MKYFVHVFLVLLPFLCICEGYKILAVFPMPMHSHHILATTLVSELVNRNHEVTFVTPYPQKSTPHNLREVSVGDLVKVLNVQKKELYNLDKKSVFESVHFLTNVGYIMTQRVLENENVQKLLHTNEHYDLVMLPQFINEALLGIGYHFKAPVILVSPMPLFSWASFLLSHPSPPSYVPNLLSPYTGHMNFWQRLVNSVYDAYSILYHQFLILPKHRQLVKKYIPGEPDLYQFLNNASLLLLNSHVSTYEATPQVPNTVEIGGAHIKEPQRLSPDLEKFLNESSHGVVVFSMGSNLNCSELDDFRRDALLKAFSKLKEDILWKWEADNLPGQPKNVKLIKWLPQTDVLAHPNIKAFITHGGLFSTIESVYHGVPVIGIPVFSDQKMNMATAVSSGYATVVPFKELTEEKLSQALHSVLNEPRYKNMAAKMSKIMKDRPVKPLENAMYWIEYVVRHQGATHFRYPGMDLNWFQRYLIDVALFACGVTIVSLFVTALVLKNIAKCCCKSKNKSKSD